MKRHLLISSLILISVSLLAQETTRTLNWDNTDREYIEYIPTSYDGTTPAPVVFCLHGLGDNMENFANIGFDDIAEQTGWIVITPEALVASFGMMSLGTAWNSGVGVDLTGALNGDVDDSGFLIAILDSLENNFNINTDSVFFMGFSMGGFMSNRMAAEYSDRVTGVASVSGTIGKFFTPAPSTNVNTLHIHGTADSQVGYEDASYNIGTGDESVGMGAEECVEYWRNFNNCDETPISYTYPDIKEDGKTFERYCYLNGDNNSYTVFIKVNEGDHEWYYTPQNDIDYTTEIYKFFTNTMDQASDTEGNINENNINISPNPAKDNIYININNKNEKATLKVYNILGSLIKTQEIRTIGNIDITDLEQGVYVFKVLTKDNSYDKKIIINR